ncbi:MAG: nascent polypeptide-associated complex protein [Thaumarchaeota archaeon]|nr:nascent polypeptide-associated complex protein [Nitrososphaerota archaeon]
MAFPMDNRQTKRMLERMGINFEPIEDVQEVIIRTKNKDIIVKEASVSEVKAKGTRMFQVVGENVEEVAREKPKFTEEDVLLVAQQTGVSNERARVALEESNGDLAQAILKLT